MDPTMLDGLLSGFVFATALVAFITATIIHISNVGCCWPTILAVFSWAFICHLEMPRQHARTAHETVRGTTVGEVKELSPGETGHDSLR